MNFDYSDPTFLTIVGVALPILVLLKGLALWRAARNNSKAWFVVLLLVNTLGILEIVYIAVWGRKKN